MGLLGIHQTGFLLDFWGEMGRNGDVGRFLGFQFRELLALNSAELRGPLVNLKRGLNATHHWPCAREGLRLRQLEVGRIFGSSWRDVAIRRCFANNFPSGLWQACE